MSLAVQRKEMEYVIERASLDDTKAIHSYLNEIADSKSDVLFLRPNGFAFNQVEKNTGVKPTHLTKRQYFITRHREKNISEP